MQLCTWTFHLASRDKSIYRYFAPSSLSDFSVKERMLLEAVVKGMTMAQIDASNVPISKRYGERLLYETRQRFGGISTHELVRTITLLGLL